jgi:hypothetical protein
VLEADGRLWYEESVLQAAINLVRQRFWIKRMAKNTEAGVAKLLNAFIIEHALILPDHERQRVPIDRAALKCREETLRVWSSRTVDCATGIGSGRHTFVIDEISRRTCGA